MMKLLNIILKSARPIPQDFKMWPVLSTFYFAFLRNAIDPL